MNLLVSGANPILEVRDLSVRFGGVCALAGATFDVGAGQTVALIGPNGSGKTTLLNAISGRLRPDRGTVRLDGRRIAGGPAHRVARLGLARTFQDVRLYRRFTVLDNMLFALLDRREEAVWRALVPGMTFRGRPVAVEKARSWLDRVGLVEKANVLASQLSYGQSKLLELIRALCTAPRVLLLDEPAAGLGPAALDVLYGLVDETKRAGVTVVFVEHNLGVVQRLADTAIAMNAGWIIAMGRPDRVREDNAVRDAYAGRSSRHA